jgi:hypothetical protein
VFVREVPVVLMPLEQLKFIAAIAIEVVRFLLVLASVLGLGTP